jgi:hypothetical protein
MDDERPPFALTRSHPQHVRQQLHIFVRELLLRLFVVNPGGYYLRLRWLIILAEILAMAAFPLADAGAEGRRLHQTQRERSSIPNHVPVEVSIDRTNNLDAQLLPSSSSSHDPDGAPDCCGSMCHVMAVPPTTALVGPSSSDSLRVPIDSKQVTDGLKDCLERPPRRRQHPPLARSVRTPIQPFMLVAVAPRAFAQQFKI